MKIALYVIFFMFLCASVEAAVQCGVTINRVLVYKDGSVNVIHSGRGDYTYICNLNSTWKGVGVTTCAMWTSMLIKKKENGGTTQFYYADSPDYDSCGNLPTYAASPSPIYIGDM